MCSSTAVLAVHRGTTGSSRSPSQAIQHQITPARMTGRQHAGISAAQRTSGPLTSQSPRHQLNTALLFTHPGSRHPGLLDHIPVLALWAQPRPWPTAAWQVIRPAHGAHMMARPAHHTAAHPATPCCAAPQRTHSSGSCPRTGAVQRHCTLAWQPAWRPAQTSGFSTSTSRLLACSVLCLI